MELADDGKTVGAVQPLVLGVEARRRAEVAELQADAPVLDALAEHGQRPPLADLGGDPREEVAVGVGAVLGLQVRDLVGLGGAQEGHHLVGEEDEGAVVGGGRDEPVARGDEALGDVGLEVLLLVALRAHAATGKGLTIRVPSISWPSCMSSE